MRHSSCNSRSRDKEKQFSPERRQYERKYADYTRLIIYAVAALLSVENVCNSSIVRNRRSTKHAYYLGKIERRTVSASARRIRDL